ncbi:FRIGIDA-like protein 1 [Senna tora]|uniref:FRIGIDA-like protein n=1 Tax=Senna tora TaxID=362788 RepID=A0A834T6D1_9FABA|nr:FRIGIDA-like protein 1 [Senna tora]
MATLKTISAALKLIDTKKENLKKAYDELQAHSSLLSSFPLSWSDLDSHFTSIQDSLTQRFHLLESRQCDPQLERTEQSVSVLSSLPPDQNSKVGNCPSFPNDPSPSTNPQNQNSVKPRHELVALCEKMDGKGLRNYIIEHFKGSDGFEAEIPSALRCAPDPAAMILDSLHGFHGTNDMKEAGLRKIRRSCLLLLEHLRGISPKLEPNVRGRARKLAGEWKGKLMNDSAYTLGALGYLQFVLAYDLVSEVSMDELVYFSAMAANNKEVPELCRIMGLVDKVPDIIQKLIDKGKYVLAVKYVFDFNLADKIPPIPILKACVDESKKLAQRILQEGKPPTEATAREIHALKTVMKAIESHKLESEYPLASLEQRIEQLKKQKPDKKRPAPTSAAKPQQHQQQQTKNNLQNQNSGIKRLQTSAPVAPVAAPKNANSANSVLHQYQQPIVQPTGLLPEHQNPYMGPQAMPYGTIPPYTAPSAGPYGFSSVPMGSSGNPNPVASHLYSSEPNVHSGYYDRITAYGGLPHYHHPSYYPQ